MVDKSCSNKYKVIWMPHLIRLFQHQSTLNWKQSTALHTKTISPGKLFWLEIPSAVSKTVILCSWFLCLRSVRFNSFFWISTPEAQRWYDIMGNTAFLTELSFIEFRWIQFSVGLLTFHLKVFPIVALKCIFVVSASCLLLAVMTSLVRMNVQVPAAASASRDRNPKHLVLQICYLIIFLPPPHFAFIISLPHVHLGLILIQELSPHLGSLLFNF